MTKLHRLLALSAVALATAFGVPADAAERAAEGAAAKSLRAFPALTGIYRFTGLTTTSLAAGTGVQVSAHCTNWHAANTLVVRFVFRDFSGPIVAQGNFNLPPFAPSPSSTQFTSLFFDDGVLVPTSLLDQGSLEILATVRRFTAQRNSLTPVRPMRAVW